MTAAGRYVRGYCLTNKNAPVFVQCDLPFELFNPGYCLALYIPNDSFYGNHHRKRVTSN